MAVLRLALQPLNEFLEISTPVSTNMPEEKVDKALEGAREGSIVNIVALRGGRLGLEGWCSLFTLGLILIFFFSCDRPDPPHGAEKWVAAEGGFACALDLVKHIREKHGNHFCIAVSGKAAVPGCLSV